MSENDKCMAGEIYNCHNQCFIERKARATKWMQRYNSLPYEERSKRYHAVVAAGAVVTEDVEPNTLVRGVPAKVIKRL